MAFDVEVENSEITKFDENIPSYKFSAQAIITAKPGQAFVLNYWDSTDAQRKIKCDIEYKNIFCGNGYTSCVNLNDVTNCKYYDD